MPLRLEIISHHRARLGERRTKEFGIKGGTIGRSLESDWALEDSQRYLSGRHAAIDYRSGSYYIVDTSTNGVYVNDNVTPIGRSKPQRLFHGDRLRMGEYLILVHLDEGCDEEPFDTHDHVDPVERAQKIESAAPTGYTLLSDTELSALAVEEVLSDETASDALKAAAEQAALGLKLVDDEPPTERRRARPAAASPKNTVAHARRHSDRTASGSTPTPALDASAITMGPSMLTQQTALYTFMRGAGLTPRDVDPKEAALLLHRAGQLVRELAVGLRNSIEMRVQQKNTLRLANTTIQPRDNNPLKFSASVDEALENLFYLRKPEYLAAVDAVREAFDETDAHGRALLEATRTALLDYLEQLDPEDIQQKCADGGKRGLLGNTGDAKFRSRYSEIYSALAQHAPGHLPQQFVETFATAYERELANQAAVNKPGTTRAKSG